VTNLKHKFNGIGFFDGSRRHIFIVPLDGGEPRQLTDGDYDDGQLAWSPDGSMIAFVSARHQGRDRNQAQDVWVVAAAGGEPGAATQEFGPCSAPAWSPDGAPIAFAGHHDPNAMGERSSRIWLVGASPSPHSTPRNLTASLDRSIQAGPANPGAPPAPIC